MLWPLSRYRSALERGGLDAGLEVFYGETGVVAARQRVDRLLSSMAARVGDREALLISAPGRTELGGNHTDHNHGRVLAAGVSLDCLAVAAPRSDRRVEVRSLGFEPISLVLDDLYPVEKERETSGGLIRGVAEYLEKNGRNIGGFTACVDSTIPAGAGLSSSAAFEVLVGRIFDHLFNQGSVGPLELARAGRHAENVHFGKPCGFMDQIACSYQGVAAIDFKDPDKPEIRRIDRVFSSHGLALAVVDTGGSHAELTGHYADIPREMAEACKVLGREAARGVTMEELVSALPRIRKVAGDRAVLRLMHFIGENRRAREMANALENGDMAEYMRLANLSGRSSLEFLQNCSVAGDAKSQPIPVALALSDAILRGRGACRVHGGGFAGTIQALVPVEDFARYSQEMARVFGKGSVIRLRVRPPANGFLALG